MCWCGLDAVAAANTDNANQNFQCSPHGQWKIILNGLCIPDWDVCYICTDAMNFSASPGTDYNVIAHNSSRLVHSRARTHMCASAKNCVCEMSVFVKNWEVSLVCGAMHRTGWFHQIDKQYHIVDSLRLILDFFRVAFGSHFINIWMYGIIILLWIFTFALNFWDICSHFEKKNVLYAKCIFSMTVWGSGCGCLLTTICMDHAECTSFIISIVSVCMRTVFLRDFEWECVRVHCAYERMIVYFAWDENDFSYTH